MEEQLKQAKALLKEATAFIDRIKFEEGENMDPGGDESLEGRINKFLNH